MPDYKEKAGALWRKTSKNNPDYIYLGGNITIDGKEYWIKAFPNDQRPGKKDPAYQLFIEPKEEQNTYTPAYASSPNTHTQQTQLPVQPDFPF